MKTLVLALLLAQTHYAVLGRASIYADKFEGRTMANGQVFCQKNLTVASRAYPLGTKLRITRIRAFICPSVVVTVTDRGPYSKYDIDLSRAVAKKLGITMHQGWGYVMIEKVDTIHR